MYRERDYLPLSDFLDVPVAMRPSGRRPPPSQRPWNVGDRAPGPADTDPTRGDRASA